MKKNVLPLFGCLSFLLSSCALMGNPFGSNSPFGSRTNSSEQQQTSSSALLYSSEQPSSSPDFDSSKTTDSSRPSYSSGESISSQLSSTATTWDSMEFAYEELRAPILSDDGNWFLYGIYPQTWVSDSQLIDELNRSASLQPNGWYNLNGVLYAKVIATPCRECDSHFDSGEAIVGGKEYWFICQPIIWRILDQSGDECLAVSEFSLDAHIFNEAYSERINGHYANNYAESSIRKWLIEDFYSAAFVLGNDHVLLTDVDNSAATMQESPNQYACVNTEDYVFLLSFQDYLNVSYGFTESEENSDSRRSVVTDWARARGAFIDGDGCGYHWTRSASSSNSTDATSVEYGGNLYGNNFIDDHKFSVRPAIRVRLPQSAD